MFNKHIKVTKSSETAGILGNLAAETMEIDYA